MCATSITPDPPGARRSALRDLLQRCFFLIVARPFLALWVGLRVRGRENLPPTDPFILVANHSSHLDTLSLLSLFPGRRLRHIRPVAAADYFERNAVISWLTRTLFNTLPIVRRGFSAENDPRDRMVAALDAGHSLILFPEGTRGAGTDIGRFKGGIADVLGRCPDVTVTPAFLVNMGRSLPKGEFLPVPFFCEIRIGEPLKPRGAREEIVAALERAVAGLKE